jgi:hypothetical protein
MNCPCETNSSTLPEAAVGTAAWPPVLPDAATLEALRKQFMAPETPPPQDPSQLRSATQLCELCQIKLKPDARVLLRDDHTPQQFYQRLVSQGCLADARRILAHALPKQRAIWWGCLVAADVSRHRPVREIDIVLPLVWRFLGDPTDENRRATAVTGKLVPANSLAGALAMAAFFSKGSVSLPQLPVVHPRPFVTGRLVGVVVYLASVARDAAHYKEYLRHYLSIGEEIASGRLLWTDDRPNVAVVRYDAADALHTIRGPHDDARNSNNSKPGGEGTTANGAAIQAP